MSDLGPFVVAAGESGTAAKASKRDANPSRRVYESGRVAGCQHASATLSLGLSKERKDVVPSLGETD